MDSVDKTRGIRLVPKSRAADAESTPETSRFPPNTPFQTGLFSVPDATLLIFVFFPKVNEKQFRYVLNEMKPTTIVDMRPAPRFDLGRLDRREALGIFEHIGAVYFDIGRALGINGCSDSELFLQWIEKTVNPLIMSAQSASRGPTMFLLNEEITGRSAIGAICAVIPQEQKWTVLEWPEENSRVVGPSSELIAL